MTQNEMIYLKKRTENTIRITMGKFNQPDTQTPCWTRSKEKSPTPDEQSWRPPKKTNQTKPQPKQPQTSDIPTITTKTQQSPTQKIG